MPEEKKKLLNSFWEKWHKSENFAYFGLSGPDLRPLERFNQIQLYSQSKLP